MSIAVDFVSEVINVSEEDISEAPDFGAAVQTDYILGIAKHQGSIKIILNIEKVLNDKSIMNIIEDVKQIKPED